MDMRSEISHERIGIFTDRLLWLKDLMEKYRVTLMEICMMTKKVGQEDPRRVIHSLKVGLSLMLVSLFYYSQTLYNSFGVSALWAVMTVIVVFEFSVGATLGKGLNRALATLSAGALGVGAHYLAAESGKIGEPILLGIFVTLQAALTTFARFFPKIKARYDYGMVMFIATFCLVSVSSFRNSEILDLAQRRLSTILIGASICVIVSICVYPVWAGQDLQNLVALNIEKLAVFLEGNYKELHENVAEFGEEYFKTSEEKQLKVDNAFMQGYKTVLNSGSIEETLANFARWEPSHGRFMYRHPWKHYLKVGRLTRECAYRIDALNAHLNTHTQQMPTEICDTIQSTCMKMSLESGMALKEIAHAIKTMSKPSNSSKSHLSNLKIAAESLKLLLKLELWREVDFVQMIQVVTVASVLFELVLCVEKIVEAVDELAVLAQFKSLDANA